MTAVTINKMKDSDWHDVSRIYGLGIATGDATFESEIPSWKGWNNSHLKKCRLIASYNDSTVGWAALSPVSSRCVYGGVAEVSVYVDTSYNGNGVGSKLLKALIEKSEEAGLWTLQSGIFPENVASIKIHERLGFRTIGYKEKIGKMKGIWRDNIVLERRSKIIGIN